MTNRSRYRGFTLIEMVITLAIVALLAVSAMPLAELVAKREKEAQLRAALREIRTAIDAYAEAAQTGHIKRELGDSGFPPNLAALYEGVDDIASEKKVKLYFIRRIPRDPFFPDGAAPAEQTWGQRSYQSPPEQPQPVKSRHDHGSTGAGGSRSP